MASEILGFDLEDHRGGDNLPGFDCQLEICTEQ
jgi:hypothetical protein